MTIPPEDFQTPNNPSDKPTDKRFAQFKRGAFIALIVLVVLLLIDLSMVMKSNHAEGTERDWTIFWAAVRNQDMESVKVREDGVVIGTRKYSSGFGTNEPTKWKTRLPLTAIDGNGWREITLICNSSNTKLSAEPDGISHEKIFAYFLAGLIALLGITYVIVWQFRPTK